MAGDHSDNSTWHRAAAIIDGDSFEHSKRILRCNSGLSRVKELR